MDLRKLEIFISVAQYESFSLAAQQLHMAQPAVSIAIRKLEDELSVVLFERNNRSVHLTAEGKQALNQAKQILQQVSEFKHSMQSLDGKILGELSIASPSMLATYFFPQVLGEFLSEHTGITADIKQAGTQKIASLILQDEVELGVVNQTHNQTGLEAIPLIQQNLVLCVSDQHALAKKKSVNVTELDALPMVLYQSDYFIRQQFDQLCQQHQVQPDIRMQCNFLPLLSNMVNNNFAATVALEMMPQQEAHMCAVNLKPKMHLDMMLAWRKGRMLSRASRAFIEWLQHQ
ncbi:MAG: LysR family transcriptional regulator [Gammaproteobacteria bacterium]|nr:LysR family transcriptional regulator [Gammaproteobacteria bacterium]